MITKLFKKKAASQPVPLSRYSDFKVEVNNKPIEFVRSVRFHEEDLEIEIAIPENDPFGDSIKSNFYSGREIKVKVLRQDGTVSGSKTYKILNYSFEGDCEFTDFSDCPRVMIGKFAVKQVGAYLSGSGGCLVIS